MKFTIVAVGKLKERFWADACAEYLKRLQPYAKTTVKEIPDVDPARAGGVDAAREREGAGIKGEIVLVIDGPSEAEDAAAEQDAEVAARARAAELKAAGVRSKDVARAIAEEFGIARNAAYDISLEA